MDYIIQAQQYLPYSHHFEICSVCKNQSSKTSLPFLLFFAKKMNNNIQVQALHSKKKKIQCNFKKKICSL